MFIHSDEGHAMLLNVWKKITILAAGENEYCHSSISQYIYIYIYIFLFKRFIYFIKKVDFIEKERSFISGLFPE